MNSRRPRHTLGKRLSIRLREYANLDDLSDTHTVVEYLRTNFPEYRRLREAHFTRLVARLSATVIQDIKLQNVEEQQIGKWQSRCKDSCPSDSVSEWSGKREEAEKDKTDGSGDGELVSDKVMEDEGNDEGNDHLNSSLRNLYGVGGTTKESHRRTGGEESHANWKDQKRERVQDDKETGRLVKRARRLASDVNEGDPGRKATMNTPPRQDKEDESPVENTNKPEKKRLKKPGAASKHLTLAATSMTVPQRVRYSDLGGLDAVLKDIKELIEYPLKHPEVYEWLGVQPPRGVLLHGPPGCGKTALANAIANECGLPFFRVSAPEIVSGMSGESESKIRALFHDAAAAAPSIIFIDEIDAIAQKREHAQREMERRIVAQMLTCLDDLSGQSLVEEVNLIGDADAQGELAMSRGGHKSGSPSSLEAQKSQRQGRHVIVLGATNRPDALDTALRRAGRFDREIALGIPTEAARFRILGVMCKKLRLKGDIDFQIIARKTPGFVGADLEALTKEAAAIAIARIFRSIEKRKEAVQPPGEGEMAEESASSHPPERNQSLTGEELEGLALTMDDFEAAVGKVQPSIRREGFATTPDVTWADVGSLEEIREELSFSITQPILSPEKFQLLGIPFACGVLLYGPPGCGKTLVAKAVANEAGANFISIKGPELLNKYVGESERAVRQLFSRARAAKPCVLFFDEMDALAPRRGSDNQAAERVVNQLLTEMDGVDSREGVYLVAATNRPDIIDPALLRPGRLDKVLYVSLPDLPGRVSILRALLSKKPLVGNIDVAALGMDPRLEGFSGADLAALVREACILALKESLRNGGGSMPKVEKAHFDGAMRKVKPSVSPTDQKLYNLRTQH